ncbi:MAG TPA: SAM-dependent methyltransferase [Chloroflexota bacterium]|nr:SAM-dependent methyltransferase [Chloroflexota bacterium]
MSSEAPPWGNQLLIEDIRRTIERAGGRIPFRDYMDLALYHPRFGYYCAPGEKTGRGGDYLTSPYLSPLFGQCLARWIVSGPVLEMGAGDGALAAELSQRFPYTIVERSPNFQARQQARLGTSVTWLPEFPSHFEGTVISNELLDALPVHRLVQDQERYVTWPEPGNPCPFGEELGPYSTSRLDDYFDRLGLRPAGEAEVNLDARALMETVYQRLTRGRVLTVDYGYEAAELFLGHPQGTFLTYFRHAANDDPYEHVGLKDMTSHIDFTSLIALGESYGLRTVAFTTQADFLSANSIGELLLQAQRDAADPSTYVAVRQAAIVLLDPAGMGGFRVLVQQKD